MSSTDEMPASASGENQQPKKRKIEDTDDATDDDVDKVHGGKNVGNDDDDEDDGTTCPICFDPWTSSGEHRISSLKCGHFFGLLCIEKWLKNGNDCPNCNDKATKKDIRPHYVRKLKAIDTGEKDRALRELEQTKKELRTLELDHAALKVTCQTRKEEIEKLQEQNRMLRSGLLPGATPGNDVITTTSGSSSAGCPLTTYCRLLYVKRSELIRRDALNDGQPNRYCRVMAYNETHGMLVVSQPSFTALAPGYGVRRVNMLDRRVESFVSLHKEPIRDLSFNPIFQDQLLSVSQDKTARLTNISTCAEIQRYHCESEIWSCAWNTDDPNVFFVGTKRSEIFVYDTRVVGGEPKFQLQFPLMERRPIIGLNYVPKQPDHPAFPCSGLLVQTLGSLWFFEFLTDSDSSTEVSYKSHKLAINALFWSLRFDTQSRMFLASTKPQPHARHMVCELTRVNVSEDPAKPDFQISTNIILDQTRGGSYSEKSFLRSTLCSMPGAEGQLLVLYGRGSAHTDHKLVVQEVGNDKIIQEIPVDRPIVDVCSLTLNSDHFVTVLCEADLIIYKWAGASST